MSSPTGPFPRAARIRRSREFQDLTRRGERRASETFVVFVAPRAAGGAPASGRLGITMSRRVGNAVVRNRLKRRVREWYRREGRAQAPVEDVLVIGRPGAARLDFAQASAGLSALLGRRR